MIVSISQPCYLPWLGYFDRIARSDLHVVLDHVQFEKGSMTNRNKILSKNGEMWLTVPVKRIEGLATRIFDVEVDTTVNWKRKHIESIRQCYRRGRYFDDYFSHLVASLEQNADSLVALISPLTTYLLDALGISTPIMFSSQMGVTGIKSDLVLALCKESGASRYISGPFGRNYLERQKFEEAGIEVVFHDYAHPAYFQVNTATFVPRLSIIDLLFNHGPESLNILTSKQQLGTY